MPTVTAAEIKQALAHANGCVYLLTSRYNGKSDAMIATSAQLCGEDPPLICIAARKGHRVDLLIRDSHIFALCCIPAGDRLLLRRFGAQAVTDVFSDPFDGLDLENRVSGAPILKRSIVSIDCKVFRQFDLETDHELIIGQVLAISIKQ